ncbi:MAG: cytochrome b N-terminal domain-containing protein [Chloroflexota bacterium]
MARKLLYGGIVVLLLAGALLLAPSLHASAYEPGVLDELSSVEVPPAKLEPCLHCHIQGEHKNLWTPTARWLVFGTLGLVFLFGFWQSASIWTQRKPFKPLTTRVADWIEERYQIAKPLNEMLKKPVPSFARWWWYCLGGITFFLFLIQGTTGILLAFYYKPTAAEAYASIQFIENEVYFGAAIRAIHHWSANGMIVMAVAHMIRVFIMGAYKPPREMNWASGVILLVLTLAFGFTGYLLPWDQRAFWASTVGTDIAGAVPAVGNLVLIFLRDGWGVTEATLGRFFGLHVLVIPIATVVFMLLHFMMIRRLGVKRPL